MFQAPMFKHDETEKFIIDDNLGQIYSEMTRNELCNWLVNPPNTTYLRVNTLKMSRFELLEKIKCLSDDTVEPHDLLDDIIVVTKADQKSCQIDEVNENFPISQIEREIQNLQTQEADQKSHQIEEVKDNLPIVVVGSGCACAVLRGAEIFAPGIIGASSYMNKNDRVLVYTDLTNKLLKGSTKFNIEEYTYVGQGVTHLSRTELFKEDIQSGLAVTMTSTSSQCCPRINDESLRSLKEYYLMQNLPSILTVHQLDITPNDKCLDMCAAPGGKTTHIATLLGKNHGIYFQICSMNRMIVKYYCQYEDNESNGHVLAIDRSKAKISQIQQLSDRLGIAPDKFTTLIGDSTKIDLEIESFDKILLDAPCSALGQRPMIVQDCKVKELKSFAKLQKKLFEKAVTLLKPGGMLVFSTCTITIEENEGLIKWALEKYGEIIELCHTLPKLGENGYDLGEHSDKVQRFGPGVKSVSTIGFFIAKFRKIK